MKDQVVKEAMEMVTKVSLALGEMADERQSQLTETQRYALDLAEKHGGLRRYDRGIYWVGADIADKDIKKVRYNAYPDISNVGTHSVNALARLGLLKKTDKDTAILAETSE